MSEHPRHGSPAGGAGSQLIESISLQFEAALQSVQDGHQAPELEVYLMSIAEADRPSLEKRLRQIAAEYELRRRRPQPTLDQESCPPSDRETPYPITVRETQRVPHDRQPPPATDSPPP